MSDVAQFGRKVKIALGNAAGEALDFSQFKCVFNIRRGDFQNPNSCDLRIYNLADATANRIRDEFTQMEIQAGYEGNCGVVFQGTIIQTRRGRLNQKDSYVDVTSADGDEAYNFSTMALSLAAGATAQDKVQAFIAAVAKHGVNGPTWLPPLAANASIRGCVLFGPTKDELRAFAKNNQCSWSIQDGNLALIPLNSFLPGEPILISATTGLIGVPEQTAGGIHMRVLLNPSIKIGQLVKLDNASALNLYRYSLDVKARAANALLARGIKTNDDGLYYVMVATHRGDTRGNDWYTDLTCLAVDATAIPPAVFATQAVAPAKAIKVP